MNGHISSTDNIIGERIRLLRRKREWTQEQTCERLGISIPAYSKIETGLTTVNMKRLEQLAQIFDTTVHELMHSSGKLDAKTAELEMEELQARYEQKTTELIVLQMKAIKLYDELHDRKLSKRKKQKLV